MGRHPSPRNALIEAQMDAGALAQELWPWDERETQIVGRIAKRLGDIRRHADDPDLVLASSAEALNLVAAWLPGDARENRNHREIFECLRIANGLAEAA